MGRFLKYIHKFKKSRACSSIYNMLVQMNLFIKKLSHRCRKQTYGYQGETGGGGINWEVGTDTMAPTPVLLPGKSHGRRSLVGCSPWGRRRSDTTERLHFHFSLSCIGEGNSNSLQCSCLENPRDGGAWWAAVYGVAQSWTRLKSLSSSSIHTTLYKTDH